MNKVFEILLLLVCSLAIGCTSRTIEDALTSDDFVRWNKEQQIDFSLFKGSGPKNAYSAWVGIYFIYDLRNLPEFRFNVTTILDKNKSYASEINEMTDLHRHEMFPQLYKLKFDHFEISTRRFRKYLLENQTEFTEDSKDFLEEKSKSYFDEADEAWESIMEEIERNDDYTEEHFRYLRNMIDLQLAELKEFDSSKNNYL